MEENGKFKKKHLFSFSKLNNNESNNKNTVKNFDFLSSLFVAFSLIEGGCSYFIFLCVIKPDVNTKTNNKKSNQSLN